MTTTPTSGAAIKRYNIGYREDEWGQRSSTPGGIPDASGLWVRYADHVTALAAQTVAEPADTVVLNAAMWAIKQAIELIGAPTDERMRAVRRVLRGAVIVAEDAGKVAPQPSPTAQAAESVPEGFVAVPVEVAKLYDFMHAAFVPMTPRQEQIAISLELARKACGGKFIAAAAQQGGPT